LSCVRVNILSCVRVDILSCVRVDILSCVRVNILSCVRVNILLPCTKHLYDCIIILRGEVWVYKTSLTLLLYIEVAAPSQESQRSCICVSEVMYMCARGHVYVC
jgi:hypothetical protein